MTPTPIDIGHLTLPNGLRVVHNYDPTTAMAATNLMFDTGARDESRALTGIAHLFEHLMFGGSANVKDFDGILTAAGGTSNAWTSNDFTAFWNIIPAHNIETIFYLESDRMLSPSLTSEAVDIQRAVVIEEFKQQCLNRPYGLTGHRLRQMMYPPAHPYSWPVIGLTPDHVAAATAHDMSLWFERHYQPANAVLAVTGNVPRERVWELAHKWFDDIPARPVTPRTLPDIPDPATTVRQQFADDVPATVITVAWLTDPYGTMDYTAADAITDILASGKASRFYRRLIIDGPGWFADADASVTGSEHRGMLMLSARLQREDIDIERATDIIIDQARRLASDMPVTDHELGRLHNRQKSMYTLGNLDYLSRAHTIATAEMHREPPEAQLTRYLNLTRDHITNTARTIFSSPHAVLVTRPR